MFFNRKGINQKNWRMIKKGKHFLFGCTLFLATGAVMIQNPHLVHADEMVVSLNDSTKSKDEDPNSDKVPNDVENHPQIENHVKESDKISENVQEDKSVEKAVENTVKAVNKTALNELIEKIRNTDLQNKTVKSVENLNLSLSRAQAVLDKEGVSQDEIDKEVQVLSDSFAQLEEKNNDIYKKEKQADKANDSDEKKNLLTEKIAKVQALVSEINQLAREISYEFSESESKSLQAFGDLSKEKSTDSEVDGALNEAKSLRNKVANRVTRAHSGKRDPRNGKPIDGKGESRFRGIIYNHIENRRDGNLIENGNTAVYYNSDEIWSKIEIKGERVGNERKFTTHVRGKLVEDETPYYIVTVGFTDNSPIKGLKMQVAYWDKKAGVQRSREIEYGKTEINNPITNAAIRGVVGEGGIVQPGRYEVHIASNTRVAPNQLKPYTFTFIIKPQSERNTVKDLSQTYVDDVRHLTENEKTALIEKFKTEHPDVMKPSGHKSDFERAEISADGTTLTIHFKDGFNPKTIQTNATNDVEAKHSSLTAYFGDSKELYTNPRELVRSKTGHEVPATAQVTYKTPFNLQQAGTRNVVVTTTYQNGVTKDVTTPYTVLDFIGKQDKKINQNQSGQLGDARNYVTVSDNSAVPSELTVRWKGGTMVDTSTAGFQHKEIEILRGNHLMKTVNIPVEIIDNIKPTITAPDNITLTRLEGLPSEINIQAKDNDKGVGLKDGNAVTVENLPAPLTYNAAKSKIEINGVIPNNFQLGKSSIQVTVKAVDKKGNTATKNITFNIQSQTQKYTATANGQKQEVSYAETPDAGTSIQKNGLPADTRYSWATKPSTTTGPGDKTGVVTVTYPDGSKDVVTVNVTVRKVSEDFTANGTQIEVNQNVSVTPEMLKGAVTATNAQGENGNTKIVTVEAKAPINTEAYGDQTIQAKVTYVDGSEQDVTIPLKVKDVTDPTIQTPAENTIWEMTALDKILPSMKIKAEDNANGSGIATIEVRNMPSFLTFDQASGTIVFKEGVREVPRIDSDNVMHGVTIVARDKAGNSTSKLVNITVSSMRGKYTPTAIAQEVDNGHVPDPETSVNKTGLPDGTTVTWKTRPDVSTPGSHPGVALVHYPDGTEDEVEVPVRVKEQKETFNPTAKAPNQTVRHNEVPDPEKSINTNDLPKGTNYSWSEQPDTSKPGSKTGKVLITYPDKSTEEVTVTVEVTPQNDEYNPTAIAQEVDNGHVPDPETSVNKTGLPDGTTVTWKTRPDVSTPGSHPGVALVHYPDGTEDEVEVPVRVKEQKETFNPTAKAPNQTVRHNEVPDPEKSINTNDLPKGTNYSWSEQPDTSKPGSKTGKVLITYPDKSTEEVTVTVEVTPQNDEYNPTAIAQEVDNGHVPDPETSVNKTGLPDGTTVTWKTRPDVSTPGSHPGVALVHYPDGTEDEVEVPVRVKEQKETFNPTAKAPNQTVRHNEVPDPEKSINTNDLPKGTNYSWSEQPDTSKPGSKTGKVLITYPDKSTEEVTVTVEVTPQKDNYDPQPKAQTVEHAQVPSAKDSIENVKTLPEGTTFGWKDGKFQILQNMGRKKVL